MKSSLIELAVLSYAFIVKETDAFVQGQHNGLHTRDCTDTTHYS